MYKSWPNYKRKRETKHIPHATVDASPALLWLVKLTKTKTYKEWENIVNNKGKRNIKHWCSTNMMFMNCRRKTLHCIWQLSKATATSYRRSWRPGRALMKKHCKMIPFLCAFIRVYFGFGVICFTLWSFIRMAWRLYIWQLKEGIMNVSDSCWRLAAVSMNLLTWVHCFILSSVCIITNAVFNFQYKLKHTVKCFFL